jgi:hypothetical protein
LGIFSRIFAGNSWSNFPSICLGISPPICPGVYSGVSAGICLGNLTSSP